MNVQTPTALIIGGGPSGLTAATALRRHGVDEVLVVEREGQAGGIPRHSDHHGFGVRDKHSFSRGPRYAARLVREAHEAGVEIRTSEMVTEWSSDRSVVTTSSRGRTTIAPETLILATGARERPRPARMVPGGRPAGVFTTGELQNAVHLHHLPIGSRAVVVGAELVSWSAVMTLKEAGVRTQALISRHDHPESYSLFTMGGRLMFRPSIHTRSRVVRIIGRRRVEGLEVENLITGERTVIPCDTVVFTGDWIPDHELARSGGIPLDAGTSGPAVDSIGRTAKPGVFAAGNLVHPVDTADVAALNGRHVGTMVARYLAGGVADGADSVPLLAGRGFVWVSPHSYSPTVPAPSRNRLQSWVHHYVPLPVVTVVQDRQVISRRRLPWPASPGRVFRLPWAMFSGVDPQGGPAEVHLDRA